MPSRQRARAGTGRRRLNEGSAIFDEFLVDPAPAVVPPPHLAKHQPTGDRTPRDEDGPEVPNLRPGRLGTRGWDGKMVTVGSHTRPVEQKASARYRDRAIPQSSSELNLTGQGYLGGRCSRGFRLRVPVHLAGDGNKFAHFDETHSARVRDRRSGEPQTRQGIQAASPPRV